MLKEEMIICGKMTNKERDALFELIKKEEATFKEKLIEEIRSDILPKYSMKLKEDATPHIAAMAHIYPKEAVLENYLQRYMVKIRAVLRVRVDRCTLPVKM